jgi:Flp pilus assembly protein TadD
MKSPLVEALRQASGKKSTAEESATHDAGANAEQTPDVAAAPDVPQSDDLELMDTVAVSTADNNAALPVDDGGMLPIDPEGVLPIDGGGILPIDGGGILPIDGVEATSSDFAAAANEEADAEFYETSSLQLRDDAATVASGAEAGAPTPLPPLSTNRQSHMPRLGLYSPLICLALAAASMGGYFAYQKVGGWYHNSDLESLLSQIGATAAQDTAGDVATEAAENHFQLIVGPQDSPRRGAKGQAVPGDVLEIQQRPSQSQPKTAPVAGFRDEAFDELNAAYDAFEHGDTIAAEAGYRRALELAPRHPNALQGLAAILFRTGRHDEALQHYETLLSVDPGNSAAAVALLSGGDASPAAADESEIKYLIQRHPDSAHLRFALGTHFAKEMRWADARHAFDQALRMDPGNADFLFNLAVSLEHLGQYDDARYYYESALSTANATSTLNNDVVVARIEQLELLAKSERLIQ